jgi:hypothetical protein
VNFDATKITETLAMCDKLIANYGKQIETMGELKRALIAECGKHLDEPAARDAFICAKTAELAAMGCAISATTDRVYRLRDGRPLGRGGVFYNPAAEHIANDIKRARAHVHNDQGAVHGQ